MPQMSNTSILASAFVAFYDENAVNIPAFIKNAAMKMPLKHNNAVVPSFVQMAIDGSEREVSKEWEIIDPLKK